MTSRDLSPDTTRHDDIVSGMFSSSMKYHFTTRRSPASTSLIFVEKILTPSLFLSLLSLSLSPLPPSINERLEPRSSGFQEQPSGERRPTPSQRRVRPTRIKIGSAKTRVPPSRRRPLLAGVNVGYALATRGGSVHASLARRSRPEHAASATLPRA